MADLSLYQVDLDTLRPNPNDPTKVLRGDSPRTAFQKHNDLVTALTVAIRHASPLAPSPTAPYMVWLDTGSNPPVEYQRNAADTAWVLKTAPLSMVLKGNVANVGQLPTDAKVGDAYVIGTNIYAWSGTTWVNLGPLTGPQGPQGIPGTSYRLLGQFDNVSQLPATASPGDSYNVNGVMYSWNGGWTNVGAFRGPIGLTGPTGSTGSSAYQVALANGFVGTEAQWLASLKGPPGISMDVAVNGQTFNAVTKLKFVGEGITTVFANGVLTVELPYAVPPAITQTYNNGDYFASNDYVAS